MLPGPAKSIIMLATEVAQQARHPEGLPTAVIPTTLTYALRVILKSESLQIQQPAMIEDFELADCWKNIADPPEDFGVVIEWCA
jgi:hypothetical protein